MPARLVRRYKRFLADVELSDGQGLTVYCPNTGAMRGCQDPGSRVWLSASDNPRRKYRYTWEIVETRSGTKVGINTGRSNALVAEALTRGLLQELDGYSERQHEVAVAAGRLDFLLSQHPLQADCFVEVKNVTAVAGRGAAIFPDAVSTRATRHLQCLIDKVAEGFRAALIFCVQRDDVDSVAPADEVDPTYGAALREAAAAGVGLYALKCRIDTGQITLRERVQISLPRL